MSIENLMGSNPKFNSVLSRLENLENDAVSNLEATASTATAAAETQLSNLTNDLRAIVPEGFSVPNVSLQSQLQSLSGLVDPAQSANLLASITTDFGDALSTSGFSLDTLVSDAASAFGLGDSLSGTIPNFELSPLGDIIQKASEIKVPTIDPVIEEVSKFTENADFAAAKTAAINAVITTSKTLPTVDAGVLRVSEKSKKVTQVQNGVAITKAVTTASQAVETTAAGVVSRKNISDKGFSHQTGYASEKFTYDQLTSAFRGSGVSVVLSKEATKIRYVLGFTQEPETTGVFPSGKPNLRHKFEVVSEGANTEIGSKYRYKADSWYLSDDLVDGGTEVNIKQDYREYDRETKKDGKTGETKKTIAIKVGYTYNKTYDPIYAKLEEA